MGTGAGTETRAGGEMGTMIETWTGSGRAEERGRSARNHTPIIVVDVMWETGETLVKRENKT